MGHVEIRKLKDGMFSDPKTGWSAFPFLLSGEKNLDVRGVHVVAIYPGQVRGNHYHEEAVEYQFMFAGTGEFYWEKDGDTRKDVISGTPTVITIPPGVRHAFRNTGEKTVYLLAVREGEHDPRNPDTVRSPFVE